MKISICLIVWRNSENPILTCVFDNILSNIYFLLRLISMKSIPKEPPDLSLVNGG